jgi:uncharacterized protein YuzE
VQISYDRKADALYIRLRTGKFGTNKEVEEGVVLDLDEDGALLGIEVLEASSRLSLDDIAGVEIRMPLDLVAASADNRTGVSPDFIAHDKPPTRPARRRNRKP